MVTEQSLDDQVRSLFKSDPGVRRDPYPLYARLRDEAPVYQLDPTTVIVSRHADAKLVYHSNDRFPNPSERDHGGGRLDLLSESERELYLELIEFERTYLSRMNGERHRRVRSAGQRAFTPRRVEELRARTETLTDELLDRLAEQEDPDLIEFASRLPLLVIMEMFGAPYEDADRLKQWGDDINHPSGQNPAQPEAVVRAHQSALQYRAYVRELVERHRRSPSPTTLVAALLDASAADQMTEEELAGLYVLILFAGHETTANLIGNGVLGLLQQRQEWSRLCDDPSLAPSAVEELLRYDSPTQFFLKQAAADDEIAGVPVAAGTHILLANAAANRDPHVFPDPDRVDVARRPNDHLSLGKGVHFCLGSPVARLEGAIVFETLSRRFPQLELAIDPAAIEWNDHFVLRGAKSLPVRLGKDTHYRASS